MKCEDINKLLAAYLDEELIPEERSQIEAHLAACEKCQEELRLLASNREGLRQALKAKATEAEPSPQAWDNVRHRITPKPSFWEQFSSVLNRPVWRAAIPIVLVLIVVGALWGTGVLPGLQGGKTPVPAPSPTAPVPTPAPGPSRVVEFDRIPDTTSPYGGKVEIKLSFTNMASEPRIMSSYSPKINVELPNLQPPDSIIRSFDGGAQEILLQPGETVTYVWTWDQHDENGQQVAPGWYGIEVTVLSRKPSETSSGSVRGWATRVLVLPPGGVMEKTIDVNKSQTVGGITITLERVELSATGMKVYAFNTPPNYSLPPGQPGPAPSFWVHAEAEYSVDGGAVKQAGPSGIRFLDNGMRHTWDDNLNPVPKTARELTFIITKLGDWVGSWEFRVPLQ